jgi:hypothetical protein
MSPATVAELLELDGARANDPLGQGRCPEPPRAASDGSVPARESVLVSEGFERPAGGRTAETGQYSNALCGQDVAAVLALPAAGIASLSRGQRESGTVRVCWRLPRSNDDHDDAASPRSTAHQHATAGVTSTVASTGRADVRRTAASFLTAAIVFLTAAIVERGAVDAPTQSAPPPRHPSPAAAEREAEGRRRNRVSANSSAGAPGPGPCRGGGRFGRSAGRCECRDRVVPSAPTVLDRARPFAGRSCNRANSTTSLAGIGGDRRLGTP